MVSTLVHALVPVFLIAAAGALLARLTRLDFRSVHVFAYWVAGPALVFQTVHQASMNAAEFGAIALFAASTYIVLLVVAMALGRALRWGGEKTRAAALALASTNCANYGLPVVAAAFGAEGLAIGTAFVSVHIIVHVALGGAYAGWGGTGGLVAAAKRALGIPYLYAVVLALALRAVIPELPAPVDETLGFLGRTWIPLLIVLLGVELAAIPSLRGASEALPLTAAKLILPPLLAFGLSAALGLDGPLRAVLILQASMPTAVNGVVFARQFGVRPALVAATLAFSTLGSLATLPLLLGILS